jgi:hypothetical protein
MGPIGLITSGPAVAIMYALTEAAKAAIASFGGGNTVNKAMIFVDFQFQHNMWTPLWYSKMKDIEFARQVKNRHKH